MTIVGNQRGQGMTEYIIIAILVGLVVLFSVNRFGGSLRRRFGVATATVNAVQVTDVNQQNTKTFFGGPIPEDVDLAGGPQELIYAPNDAAANVQQ